MSNITELCASNYNETFVVPASVWAEFEAAMTLLCDVNITAVDQELFAEFQDSFLDFMSLVSSTCVLRYRQIMLHNGQDTSVPSIWFCAF